MATTPYKPTSWSLGEQITREKLNQMCSNDQYIFENQPVAFYNAHGIKKTSGLKIMGGYVYIKGGKGRHYEKEVYFGNFFSVGCKPIVVTSQVIQKQSRIHCIIRGVRGEYWPDHRGFTAVVDSDELSSKSNYFHYGVNVHFLALGY
ncbi:hypothetical protein SEA_STARPLATINUM_69 [Streptomyces phage StarPlatinum]|uniref:Uncharacterized protein n=1 Tax=Streptomyces phage StarPlatinum TaxID=2283265 RepID=A0A345M8J6_9CAUD|nr:hypothetical protein HWB77_gp220 [Streptomyces phage StarPlatinum]AXH66817.1 hypothetical protein SEA_STARPLATINUM_69 [Streptomyces phage StarPlatinum]